MAETAAATVAGGAGGSLAAGMEAATAAWKEGAQVALREVEASEATAEMEGALAVLAERVAERVALEALVA